MWLGKDDGKTTEQRVNEALTWHARINRSIDKEVGGNGWLSEDSDNVALGQNILREETGYFGPWEGVRYGFDDETRNRLLAHGRQDAASAFAMARSAFREAHYARRLSARAGGLLLLSVALNSVTLVTLVAVWYQSAN